MINATTFKRYAKKTYIVSTRTTKSNLLEIWALARHLPKFWLFTGINLKTRVENSITLCYIHPDEINQQNSVYQEQNNTSACFLQRKEGEPLIPILRILVRYGWFP